MVEAYKSRGLKIALAAFMTLTVILLAVSYFLYSAQSQAMRQYEELRLKIGRDAEEYEQAAEEMNTHFEKVNEKLKSLATTVNAAFAKAAAAGAQGPDFEQAKDRIQKVIASYRHAPQKTYISSLDRFAELMENLSLMTTEMSIDYVEIRHSLDAATEVAKAKVDVQAKAAASLRARPSR